VHLSRAFRSSVGLLSETPAGTTPLNVEVEKWSFYTESEEIKNPKRHVPV
jgi:hypothetical protein